jgi:hypothetical protein
MPPFKDGFSTTAWCQRCDSQQTQWISNDGDRFTAHCHCTDVEVSGLTCSPNGPTMGAVTRPEQIKGLRHSRRLISVGRHGRLWREIWRCSEGVILESGSDFVAIVNRDGQQLWHTNFEAAFYQLTGQIWRTEGGA